MEGCHKKPYLQGALDSLCAVYGIVNSAKIINNLNEDQCRELFNKILIYLKDRDFLCNALIDGVNLLMVGSILKDVASDVIPYRHMPFKITSPLSLESFWSEMSNFLNEKNRTILLAVNGYHWDHWSVITHMSDTHLYFFDSHKLKKILRHRCTIGKVTKRRPHLLCTTHTYFLSKDNCFGG